MPSPTRSPHRYVGELAALAVAYALAAQASFAFKLAGTNVSLVWLPAGLALAVLLSRGGSLWPAVPVAQAVVALLDAQGPFNTFRVAAAATAGLLVSYGMLRRLGFEMALARPRDALGLVAAVALGGLVGAVTNGVLRAFELGLAADAGWRVLNWWLGDVTGVMLIVPLVCTWVAPRASGLRPTRRAEEIALVGLLGAAVLLTPAALAAGATPLLGLLYLAVGLQVWAAVRVGPRGAAQSFAVIAGAVLLASLMVDAGGGAATAEPLSLPLLDGFLIVSAALSLLVAALVADHARAVGDLAEAQRRDTVRRLAAGVAHDFNNLLTVILSHVNLARVAPADDHELDVIQATAVRAGALTRQLLAYAQDVLLHPSEFAVNGVVRQVEAGLREQLPRQVMVQVALAPDLPPVRTDRDQLHRVLEQLCLRGAKGMPGGGRVTIATGLGEDGMVAIHVADTGPPLPVEAQERLFEPYPGALPAGDPAWRPSGLELAMAHGFVQQVGGRIVVLSGAGGGTRVSVLLPASPGAAPLPNGKGAAAR